MSTVPKYLRIRGRIYERMATARKAHIQRPLHKLLEHWLDDGWRNLIVERYRGWDDAALAQKMADEFGVYLGDLSQSAFDWVDVIHKIRSLRE